VSRAANTIDLWPACVYNINTIHTDCTYTFLLFTGAPSLFRLFAYAEHVAASHRLNRQTLYVRVPASLLYTHTRYYHSRSVVCTASRFDLFGNITVPPPSVKICRNPKTVARLLSDEHISYSYEYRNTCNITAQGESTDFLSSS